MATTVQPEIYTYHIGTVDGAGGGSAALTEQPPDPQLDWEKLARDLNLNSAQDAARRAYQIAAYVAKVERNSDQKLLLKERGKFFEISLKSLKKGA
jgi:hypothetical protein